MTDTKYVHTRTQRHTYRYIVTDRERLIYAVLQRDATRRFHKTRKDDEDDKDDGDEAELADEEAEEQIMKEMMSMMKIKIIMLMILCEQTLCELIEAEILKLDYAAY